MLSKSHLNDSFFLKNCSAVEAWVGVSMHQARGLTCNNKKKFDSVSNDSIKSSVGRAMFWIYFPWVCFIQKFEGLQPMALTGISKDGGGEEPKTKA